VTRNLGNPRRKRRSRSGVPKSAVASCIAGLFPRVVITCVCFACTLIVVESHMASSISFTPANTED